MSEEMNKRESAPSDAELENVSGGLSSDVYQNMHNSRAERICDTCIRFARNHCNGGSQDALEAYLKEHGSDSVHGPFSCPYYKW